jgi:hypothetical protein
MYSNQDQCTQQQNLSLYEGPKKFGISFFPIVNSTNFANFFWEKGHQIFFMS